MSLACGKVLALAITLALAAAQGLVPCATALAQTGEAGSSTVSEAEAGNVPAATSSLDAELTPTSANQDALADKFVLPALPEFAERPRAIVTQVQDGDTLRLADRRTIRLACINAPDLSVSRPSTFSNEELRKGNFRAEDAGSAVGENDGKVRANAPDQYFAKEARDALKKLVLNRQVTLRGALLKKDRQGRLVADVRLEDGTSLSAWLVENGHAYVVYDPDYPEGFHVALARLQAEAMASRRGFWAVLLETGAGNHTFVGNAETLLFYSSEDVRSQQIKPRQRTYFGTLLDAFSSGYAPANSREFWPTAR